MVKCVSHILLPVAHIIIARISPDRSSRIGFCLLKIVTSVAERCYSRISHLISQRGIKLLISITLIGFLFFQHDTSGAYENLLKKFLSKSSSEARVGWQSALITAESGNELQRQAVAQQGPVAARGHNTLYQSKISQVPQLQSYPMMYNPSNIQVPQLQNNQLDYVY